MEEKIQAVLVVVLLELGISDDFSGHGERYQERRIPKDWKEVRKEGECVLPWALSLYRLCGGRQAPGYSHVVKQIMWHPASCMQLVTTHRPRIYHCFEFLIVGQLGLDQPPTIFSDNATEMQ